MGLYVFAMCNLYSLTRAPDAIRKLFRVPHNRAGTIIPLPAIFPGYDAPVIRATPDGERELVTMSRGFVLLQDGKAPRRVTNVRDDKVLSSGFLKSSFDERRCLAPASSYCEPNGEKPAKWVWFALNGEDERPLFAFPGIWRTWKGSIKKDGPTVELNVYSFMTTEPNALTRSINHERIPVLLDGEESFETWLRGTPAEAYGVVRSFDPTKMRIVQSGFEKQDLLAA